jgi:hypothetical protein
VDSVLLSHSVHQNDDRAHGEDRPGKLRIASSLAGLLRLKTART